MLDGLKGGVDGFKGGVDGFKGGESSVGGMGLLYSTYTMYGINQLGWAGCPV